MSTSGRKRPKKGRTYILEEESGSQRQPAQEAHYEGGSSVPVGHVPVSAPRAKRRSTSREPMQQPGPSQDEGIEAEAGSTPKPAKTSRWKVRHQPLFVDVAEGLCVVNGHCYERVYCALVIYP